MTSQALTFDPTRPLGAPITLGGYGVQKRLEAARRFIAWTDCVVADVGCGNGAYTETIAREARSVVGLDLQEDLLRPFQQRITQSGKDLKLACAAAESLPLRTSSVDVAFCIETLEHVEDDIQGLSELHRIIKPGGSVLITVPNKWFIFETHGLKSKLPGGNRFPFISWLPRPIHSRIAAARIYSNGQIKAMVEAAGFVDVRVDYVMPPLDKVAFGPLRMLLRQVVTLVERGPLRRLGVSLVISATKPAQVGDQR
ncbi:MAG TPA: class I SAM-dependent methyltransferase [Dehalococcoidia bacterium]|nr:class I SAM-dependent methyltransferase [Dehalococcoidia bacterium]